MKKVTEIRLEVEYEDGSKSLAWGGIDWIEDAITSAAERSLALRMPIVGYEITEAVVWK